MKIRRGFVSNSSSSSFICDVCGAIEDGWDAGLGEVGMYTCVNGHTFHNHEAVYDVDSEPVQVVLDANITLTGDEDDADLAGILEDLRGEMPPKTCPICMFQVFEDNALLMFATMELTTTYHNLCDRFKTRFNTYHDYVVWRKEKYGEYQGHPHRTVSD